ncbi:MAG: right-handed parallel beta-helix repeat-containing protein [Candidatus Abawacabacteria bacterium]|nr:right-handed parallel beta-helix repeat-containing protein [Candidatus Abawacabacteria bacterium]
MKKFILAVIFITLLSALSIDFQQPLSTQAAAQVYLVDLADDGSTGTSPVCDATDNDNCNFRQAVQDAILSDEDVIISFASDISEIELGDVSGDSSVDSLSNFINTDHSITIDGGSNKVAISPVSGTYTHFLQIGSTGTNSTNNIIKNLTITGFPNGIIIYGDNNRVDDTTLHGNALGDTCDNTGQVGISVRGRAGDTVNSGTIISNNDIGCFRKGITGRVVSSLLITNNDIEGNTSLDDEISPSIDDNECYTAGIQLLSGEDDVRIIGNDIKDNGSLLADQTGDCVSVAPFLSAGIVIGVEGEETSINKVIVENNLISGNIGTGIALIASSQNQILENTIESNGDNGDDLSDPTDDIGNGIALLCATETIAGASDNLIYQNTINNNADNGIFIAQDCTEDDEGNHFNILLENSIFENGSTATGALLENDGIGIDLQSNDDLQAGSYSNQNTNISTNDTDDSDEGGNAVVNAPVITSATFDEPTGIWTISGTADNAGSGAIIELYGIACVDVLVESTCDIDDTDATGYGFGSGENYLGRTIVADEEGPFSWTMDIPLSAGFPGGLLTATTTSLDDDIDCAGIFPLVIADLIAETGAGVSPCHTSEFSANFLAQNLNTVAIFNKFAALASVAQGGTQTFLFSFNNAGTEAISLLTLTDVLPDGLTYVPDSCRWQLNFTPSTEGDSNCSFVSDDIDLEDFTTLLPIESIYVVFDAAVDSDATIGARTNTGSVLFGEDAIEAESTADFTITATAAEECSTPDVTPNATFTIDEDEHDETLTTTPHTAEFANTTPTTGNDPITYRWLLDGEEIANGTDVADATQSIALTAGTHTVTHIVSDCDGDIVIDSVYITVTASTTTTTAVTLSKTISPASNLRNGDLVTVDLGVSNLVTSNTITALTLHDTFTGLSPVVPVCTFAIDALPIATSSSCSVTAGGNILLTLPSGGLQAGHKLHIRYLTTVVGSPGNYTNSLSLVSSTPTVASAPAQVSAQHAVIATTQACSGNTTVDAELTLNTQLTTELSYEASASGIFTFANSSTTGDGTIVYRWFLNNQLQPESGNSLVRTLATQTTVTLLKQDCNGSVDSDTVTLTFPGSTPTATEGGPFSVVKTTTDGKDMYSLAAEQISYQVQITNLDSAAHVYNFRDTIPAGFLATAQITDLAGGTNATTGREITINNITLASGEVKTVRYLLSLEDKSDFPLDSFSLDADAEEDDNDFYITAVEESDISTEGNDHDDEEDITEAPDGKFVSLGDDGSIVVDTGEDKVIVNGSGVDFALFQINNHIDDADSESEAYKVSVSQDGDTFVRISGDGAYDLGKTQLAWARYVKIEDKSSEVQPKAPGVDLDAVCILNIGVPVENNARVTSGSVNHNSQSLVYLDVTSAFDNRLKKSDCEEEETITKVARTLELVPPSLPAPSAPIVPTPVPQTELPKTGSESLLIGAILSISALLARRLQKQKK